MRRVLLAALVLVVVLGVLLARGRGPRPAVVELAPVARRAVFQSFVSASGEIVAARYADIGSNVMGRLAELRVAEGDRVAAGQVLALIDPVQARSEKEAVRALLRSLGAEARAAEARELDAVRARDRARELAAQGLLPQSELDSALAAADAAGASRRAAEDRVAQAQAQLRKAEDALSKTAITSPLAGVVTRLAVREGEMVVVGVQNQPGTILMTISDLAQIDAEVKVAEADVLRLRVGQKAEVVLEAQPGQSFGGEVVQIGASALPVTGVAAAAREFRVVVRLQAPASALKPGLTCDARILADEQRDVLAVPLQAVVLRTAGSGENAGLFVVQDGRARFTPVEAGLIGGLEMSVKGVSEGTTVVAGPFQALRELKDGDRVASR
jgi:HlyD family secretion protein